MIGRIHDLICIVNELRGDATYRRERKAISKAEFAKIATLLADAGKPFTTTCPAVGVPAEYRVFRALA